MTRAELIKKATEAFKEGKIVVFPTDTVYGVGVVIDDLRAIERLYRLKGRPATKPTPVLVGNIEQVEELVTKIRPEVKKLLEKFWPGGLTLVLSAKKEKVPDLMRGGGETIGVRMPNHPLLLKVLQKLGKAIVAPSANFAGKPPPKKFSEIDSTFLEKADFVVSGKCGLGIPSTVLDVTKKPWKIIREGPVSAKELGLAIQR
jgi:L-threonylcarbamoyladenylate synthase